MSVILNQVVQVHDPLKVRLRGKNARRFNSLSFFILAENPNPKKSILSLHLRI